MMRFLAAEGQSRELSTEKLHCPAVSLSTHPGAVAPVEC